MYPPAPVTHTVCPRPGAAAAAAVDDRHADRSNAAAAGRPVTALLFLTGEKNPPRGWLGYLTRSLPVSLSLSLCVRVCLVR